MAYYHCVSSLSQFGSGFFEDGQEVIHRVGAEHGDARLSEIGDALEDGGGGEVSSGMQDASLLVYPFNIDAQQLFEDVEFGVEIEVFCASLVQIVAYLFKYPGAPEGGTTYHDSIHTVFVVDQGDRLSL